MQRLVLGLICGIVYGALSAASMLPLQFPDKKAALTGAFLNRFAIGIVIALAMDSPEMRGLGMPPWLVGLAIGLLLSLADAVITKAYAPILAFGAVGGAMIGWIIGRWGV